MEAGVLLAAPAQVSLIRRQTALAWELRGHLWRGSEVVIRVEQDDEVMRLRGYPVSVSPTDAVLWLDDGQGEEPTVIPLNVVTQVRRPHFHEDGPAQRRRVARLEARRGPEPYPGQLIFGAERIPEVSRRSAAAMERAAGLLLPQDLLDVLAALDRAVRRKQHVPSRAVAEQLGADVGWTLQRLGLLAEMRLVFPSEDGTHYVWSPGE